MKSLRFHNSMFLLVTLIIFAGTSFAQNAPVDFETSGNGSSWTWTVFENGSNPPLEIIQNPDQSGINGSGTVAKFTALQAGMPFAGCETMHGTDIGTFTIDSSNAMITIMVWKSVISDVGIKLVRFDNWSLGEIKIPNTKVNQWEQLTFDFSSHMGNTYDQIVIFPDFNARSSDNVIYFDNVFGPEAIATDITDVRMHGIDIFPNPAQASCKLRASAPIEEIKIFSLTGELVRAQVQPGKTVTLDLTTLPKGLYLVRSILAGEVFTNKLVRQ